MRVTLYLSLWEWILEPDIAGMVLFSLFLVVAALFAWALLVRSGRVTSASVPVVFYASAANAALTVAFLLSTPGSFLSKDPIVWLIITPFAVYSLASLVGSTALAVTSGIFGNADRPRGGVLVTISTLIIYYTLLFALYPAALAFWSLLI